MPDYKLLMKRKGLSRNSPQKNHRQIKRPGKVLSKVGLLLLLGALTLSIYFAVRSFLLHFSSFRISKISVVDANGKALRNPEDIFRLDTDYNLFNFDMQRAVRDIQARHPQVCAVSIRKQFPDKLLIVVREREPLAIIALRDTYLVDAQGFILPFKTTYRNLPRIVGIAPSQIQLYTKTQSLKFKKVLQLLRGLKAAGIYPKYKISQIDVRQYANVSLYLEDGTEVKMGKGDFARKATLLSAILPRLKTEGSAPKHIDMRFGNPVVKP